MGVSENLDTVFAAYWPVHGYLSVVICVAGILGNVANIIVLTRTNMTSATNILLTGLAASDGAGLLFYLIYVLHNVVIYPGFDIKENLTYINAAVEYVYTVVGIPLNAISIWLTITLAMFRVLATKLPLQVHRYCSKSRAKFSVIFINVVIILTVGIPTFMAHEIVELPAWYMGFFDDNGTVWTLALVEATESEVLFQLTLSWITAIVHVLIPCLLLAVLSGLLIHSMHTASKRRNTLTSSKILKKILVRKPERQGEDWTPKRQKATAKDSQLSRDSRRTTAMLLIIVVLFLISGIPHGILLIFCGVVDGFVLNVFLKLIFIIDLISLLNNGFNFMLYYAMCREFRQTFLTLFCRRPQMNTRQTNERRSNESPRF